MDSFDLTEPTKNPHSLHKNIQKGLSEEKNFMAICRQKYKFGRDYRGMNSYF